MSDALDHLRTQLGKLEKDGAAFFTDVELIEKGLGMQPPADLWNALPTEQQQRARRLERQTSTITSEIEAAGKASPRAVARNSNFDEFSKRFNAAGEAFQFQGPETSSTESMVTAARKQFEDGCHGARVLLNRASGTSSYVPAAPSLPPVPPAVVESANEPMKSSKAKRGPKPKTEEHSKVATIVGQHQADWRTDELVLEEVCKAIDAANIPVPKDWSKWQPKKPHSWVRAADYGRRKVVQALEYRLKHCSSVTK